MILQEDHLGSGKWWWWFSLKITENFSSSLEEPSSRPVSTQYAKSNNYTYPTTSFTVQPPNFNQLPTSFNKHQFVSWKDVLIERNLRIAPYMSPRWWLIEPTHLKNMLVKLDHFPRDRGENKTYWKPPAVSMVVSGSPKRWYVAYIFPQLAGMSYHLYIPLIVLAEPF